MATKEAQVGGGLGGASDSDSGPCSAGERRNPSYRAMKEAGRGEAMAIPPLPLVMEEEGLKLNPLRAPLDEGAKSTLAMAPDTDRSVERRKEREEKSGEAGEEEEEVEGKDSKFMAGVRCGMASPLPPLPLLLLLLLLPPASLASGP